MDPRADLRFTINTKKLYLKVHSHENKIYDGGYSNCLDSPILIENSVLNFSPGIYIPLQPVAEEAFP